MNLYIEDVIGLGMGDSQQFQIHESRTTFSVLNLRFLLVESDGLKMYRVLSIMFVDEYV